MRIIKKIIEFLKYGRKQDGVIDLTDDRFFGSQAVYTPNKKDLKEALENTFIVFNPRRLDQLNNDMCVGYGGAYEADATEVFGGESGQGSGAYNFAGAKKWSGRNVAEFGTSILAGAMARVTYGICQKELWEYKRGKRNYFANWANIPKEAHADAQIHKAGSAWKLSVPWRWSKFDAILATLWHFRDKKVLIGTGDQAHRRTIFGYDARKKCLMNADTYGERTYERGTQYISRERARTLFTPYFVLDIARDLADLLVEFDRKVIKTETNPDCYVVRDGERHSLVDEKTAHAHGYLLAPYDEGKLVEIISDSDMEKIPEGEPLAFIGGKNEWIIRRIYEKHKLAL